jgi:hypothetical protein
MLLNIQLISSLRLLLRTDIVEAKYLMFKKNPKEIKPIGITVEID